jgi:DNA mismatch repair protein MutS2
MKLYPNSCFEDLEFDKILDSLSSLCMSPASKERVYNQPIETDLELINRNLQLVKEYKEALEDGEICSIGQFVDIRSFLATIKPANSVLPLEDINEIRVVLKSYSGFRQYFEIEERQSLYPLLFQFICATEDSQFLLNTIEEYLNDEGNIKDDATPELVNIRRDQQKTLKKINQSFDSILRQYKGKNVLIDSAESFKNGRRVLSVRSEHKRQIRGIIHDESSTGQTAYIEPEEIILLNNDLFDLESYEKKEIHRILLLICDQMREYIELITQVSKTIIELDFIRVKASYSIQLDCKLPHIDNGGKIHWIQAYHPILKTKNDALKKETVPSDFTLEGPNKIMVISGPNAGGKSIALKTVGLLQLMIQYGMLVPCEEKSKAGIFKNLMVDIGDQQSIENDLSTYSSRLKKMTAMMDQANSETLILLDEFGSGTDPSTGGALAEAILKHFLYLKCWGVLTTHYSNLKVFAYKNRGLVNARMNFDTKTISPTYKLTIGKPGSSFAFEIAEKMKVPSVVLKNAKRRLGENQVKVEDLLVSIQSEKQELEDKLGDLESKQERLDKLIKTYERLSGELEYKRKKLRLVTKEQRAEQEAEFNRQLEKTIRELQESKNIEKAKSLASQKREDRSDLTKELKDLQDDIIAYEDPGEQNIVVGNFVRMKNGNVSGMVEGIKNDKATVSFGSLAMDIPLRDLRLVGAPLEIQSNKSIQTDIYNRAANFKPKLDIRGLKMEEAMSIIEAYLDEAVVAGIHRLEIIHGKGTGVLRKIVKQKAKEYPQIQEVYHPKPEEGGEGISILQLQ